MDRSRQKAEISLQYSRPVGGPMVCIPCWVLPLIPRTNKWIKFQSIKNCISLEGISPLWHPSSLASTQSSVIVLLLYFSDHVFVLVHCGGILGSSPLLALSFQHLNHKTGTYVQVVEKIPEHSTQFFISLMHDCGFSLIVPCKVHVVPVLSDWSM